MPLKPPPKDLPKSLRGLWGTPWKARARRSRKLRQYLDRKGLITPHFSWAEARCNDGTSVPRHLRHFAIRHAWKLEQLRHALGNIPIPITGWYRTRSWNKKVGGARFSRHMLALATDHPAKWVEREGLDRLLRIANKVWKLGGIGNYPGGSVHFDSRLRRARWTSWIPGR